MQFFLGAVSMIVFLLCLGLAYRLGRKTQPKPNNIEVSDEEKFRIEKLQKEFNDVMNYNLAKALERKQNNVDK